MQKTFPLTILFSVLFCTLSFCQTTELWGTGYRGGDDRLGRIVSVNPASGNVSEVYGFPAQYSGRMPRNSRFVKFGNYLYGTTALDGRYNLGVLYRYNPLTNVSEKLYNFTPASGGGPEGGMLYFQNEFWGITANSGGANDKGTIYSYNPVTNVFTKRIDMTADISGFACTNTLAAFNGKLYATTTYGGANGIGVIFEYDPAGNTLTKKMDLTTTTGRNCKAGLTLFNNKFYGSMGFGGSYGYLFEWDPATNIYTRKITLAANDGRDFTGGFTATDTSLFAAVHQGTSGSNGGIVSYNPVANRLVTKVAFAAATGAGSYSGLTFFDDKYYGSNVIGGANSKGAFFEWNPATNTITKRVAGATNIGENPSATPAEFNGKMYCAFEYESGGPYTAGSMAEWDLSANTLVKKFDYTVNSGSGIITKLAYSNGKVYGITPTGGTFNKGVIFSIDVNTSAYQVLYTFPAAVQVPLGITPPVVYNNKLYGVAASTNGAGALYQYDLATNVYTEKVLLTVAGGYGMTGQFYLHSNNKFYGVSRYGGGNGYGTVYTYDPATNVFANVRNLGATYNVLGMFTPYGSKLYVPASTGGNTNGDGTILEFDPATNVAAVPVNFPGFTGSVSDGEFALINNVLYTTCAGGSSGNLGTIIGYVPGSGIVSTKEFNYSNGLGYSPGGTVHAYNNELYGFCVQGGTNDMGTTYKFNPATNIITKLEDNIVPFTVSATGNGFITVQRSGSLPVGLRNFTANKLHNSSALLQWNNDNTVSLRLYTIERSADGIRFTAAGTVKPADQPGNTSYRFVDESPLRRINYYRIKETSISGTVEYSEVRKLNFEKADRIDVYPNPVQYTLNVWNSSEVRGNLSIIDVQGKTVKSGSIISGKNTIRVADLPVGIYTYTIRFADGALESGNMIHQ